MKDLAHGCYQVILVSPEILNNDSHFEYLWGTKKFVDNLINLVLDRARVCHGYTTGRKFEHRTRNCIHLLVCGTHCKGIINN